MKVDQIKTIEKAARMTLDVPIIGNLYRLIECRKEYLRNIPETLDNEKYQIVENDIDWFNSKLKQLLAID